MNYFQWILGKPTTIFWFGLCSFILGKSRCNELVLQPGGDVVNNMNTSHCTQYLKRIPINFKRLFYYHHLQSSKSLLWCMVPKAGSTSIKYMLLKLVRSSQTNELSNNTMYKLFKRHFSHLEQKEADKMINSTKFLVIRHPFERILSVFRDKFEEASDNGCLSNDPLTSCSSRYADFYRRYGYSMVPKQERNGRGPYFSEFINYLINTSVNRYNMAWAPIYRLCSPCTIKYDYVIRMERLEEDIGLPLQQVGVLALNLPVFRSSGSSNLEMIAEYFRNISLSNMRKLYWKYQGDFQLFGYSPSEYFKIANQSM